MDKRITGLLNEANNILEGKQIFDNQDDRDPIIADAYQNKKGVWLSVQDRSISDSVHPMELEEGMECTVSIFYRDPSDGSVEIRIEWVNVNGVSLRLTRRYDSLMDAKNRGWKV